MMQTTFSKAMATTNIVSAFRSTGIHQIDSGAFGQDTVIPSAVTDRPLKEADSTPMAVDQFTYT